MKNILLFEPIKNPTIKHSVMNIMGQILFNGIFSILMFILLDVFQVENPDIKKVILGTLVGFIFGHITRVILRNKTQAPFFYNKRVDWIVLPVLFLTFVIINLYF